MPFIPAYNVAIGTSVRFPGKDGRRGMRVEVTATNDWSCYVTIVGKRKIQSKETVHSHTFFANDLVDVRRISG